MIKLNNGVMMPGVGFGTWQISSSEVIKNAIENGYRMIDTAPSYDNESIVGEAIRNSNVGRSKLFVITKLRTEDQGYDSTIAAFEKSLQQLELDYLDLYLIHHPTADQQKYLESWRAMEKLYKNKKVRAIGVSNFWPAQLEQIQNHGTINPMVNQIQTSPYRQQKTIRKYCTANYIVVQSSAPLAEGNELLRDEVIVEISNKLDKSPAQIILRWHLQNGLTPIPKAVGSKHQKQNLQLYDFELSPDDFNKINSLNRQIQPQINT
ncbi:aldo/keto reductase [Candidatus Saccharibacteria bacterium]|nr:aldo/keto reductase [Candidatus Saccharibacteria bacterium]